jgi:hypothetical protein
MEAWAVSMRPVAVVVVVVACLATGACAGVRSAAGEAPTVVDQAPSEAATGELVGVRQVRRELNRLAESEERIVALGNTADAVRVDLRADAEALAARLHEKYAYAVELLIGNMPYPPSKIPDDFRCPSPRVQPWPAGVTASLELNDDTLPQGGTTNGVVTMHNASDKQFVLEVKGPVLVGWVYDVGEVSTPRGHPGVFFQTVGDGGSEPTGPRRVLAPGQDTTIGVPVGTASCDPTQGYALAPGDYDVRARVGVPGRVYLSQPARLPVTPR